MKEPPRKRPVKGESEVHDYLPLFKEKDRIFSEYYKQNR